MTNYQHHYIDGAVIDLPVGKVVCVGRNYAAHAKELNNPIPEQPILFIKPTSSIVPLEQDLSIPKNQGECHYESEISVLIGKPLKQANPQQVEDAIVGYGVGLDLTLRDIQTELKNKGYPWEIAKGFDGACPLSNFLRPQNIRDNNSIAWRCIINDAIKQVGNTQLMLTPLFPLIAYMSQHFSLAPGDVILTGTPEGVGPVHSGDEFIIEFDDLHRFVTYII